MSRKKRVEEPEEQAAWMATYADMMTLLLTLFVLLFAISSVDSGKFSLFLMSMSGEEVTQEMIDKLFPVLTDEPPPESAAPLDPSDEPSDEPGGEDNPELDNLHEKIQSYIIHNELGDVINVEYYGDYLMLILTNDVWFAPGSATVSRDMQQHGVFLAQVLRDTYSEDAPFEVIVAGHTDDVPQVNPQFRNNWHLSAHRALEFLEILLYQSDLDAGIFSSRGYGDKKPIADNSTAEGKQKNRRVEILISQPKKQG